jgi:hypothetical protein
MSDKLTRYSDCIRHIKGHDPVSSMHPDPCGQWYAKDEADAVVAAQAARIAELEVLVVGLQDEVDLQKSFAAHRKEMRRLVQADRDAAMVERDAARVEVERLRALLYRLGYREPGTGLLGYSEHEA